MKTVSENDSFLFSSSHHSLYTEGVFKILNTPAVEPDNLCQAVEQGFAEAKCSGIHTPLVVGAIPFDTRKPSSLYIPRASHFVSREAFRRKLGTETNTAAQIVNGQLFPEKTQFISMVQHAIDSIKKGELQKVVLSRLQTLQAEYPLNTVALLNTLAAQNPAGYLFRLPLAEETYLFGASPELLLRQRGKVIWTTPLAGTAKRTADEQQDRQNRNNLLASKKDRHEHQLVIEDIRRVLSTHCATLDIPLEPLVIETPNLWHLASPIVGTLNSDPPPSLSLACLLHPTPALCGVPMPQARELINELEPFDRGVFGGIVGWSDAEGNGEWAVAIRCGISTQQEIRLFAGVGIVGNSDPQAEWNETEAKLRTMLNALGQ